MVLALTRYDACACAGPDEEPADDVAGTEEWPTDDCVPPATDESPPQHDAESPGGADGAVVVMHPPEDRIHYVVRGYQERPDLRFGVRGPRGVRVAARCARASCVLDAWWRGPGRYVVWIDEPGRDERAATLQLVGDELEIAYDRASDELDVTHRIEGVELREATDDKHALMLINGTERSFVTTFNDGAVLFDVVRAERRSWAGPRGTPQLSCGWGLRRDVVQPGSVTSLGSLEQNLPWLSRHASGDADTVVVILEDPEDSRAERQRRGLIVSHAWAATAPLPPHLMRRLASFGDEPSRPER